ncbi:MAG: hypothetical protein HOJ87_07905 [Rhodospirillaceae bacterium]|nr:hypothetical protein [Rhodospirillaceae bacterium]MBT5562257.1 hypothetical protein [Rhodospirillaceae bacterium]
MGDVYTRVLAKDIYEQKAIEETQKAFQEHCIVRMDPDEDGNWILSFALDMDHNNESKQVVFEFLNYALDLSVQMNLGRAN